MTMSSTVSKVTLNGDGVQTSFPFSFKVWKAADLEVSITNAAGVTTVVSNWSVSLAGTGGTVTYPTSGPALPSGSKITIARSMDFLQDVDLVSGTRWDPEVVETALDQAAAERQQLREKLDRAIVVDIADQTTPEALRDSIFAARDTSVASAASALDSAERAEIASSTVAYYNHEGTLLTGEDTISLPWAYDTEVGVEVFLGGVKQTESSLIFTDAFTVTLDTPVTADTAFEVVASAGAKGDLAKPSGSGGVGFLQDGTGAVARTVQAKLRDVVSVKDFGAVGDGVTDDTEAIQAALAAGKPLDWLDGTYKISEELVFTVSGNLTWVANNAKILYSPSSHTHSCMTISLPDGSHSITGLTIDVNQLANVGMKIVPVTNGTDEPDLLLEDVTVENPYRILAFNDGDAILTVGSFRNINIVRPVIKNCFMAVGAGVFGVYGIFGITITRNDTSSPRTTNIEDPWIENVYSDDPAYTSDQDAIRVFSHYGGSGTGGLNNPNTVKIRGGFIKNVRGRSVKLQTENAIVSGLTLHRTKSAFGGVAGSLTRNADIEVQTGGATVSDIEFQYEDFVPMRVVRCIQADETTRWASPHVVKGIRGVVSGSFAPTTVVQFVAITTTTAFESQFVASDINTVSETEFNQIFSISKLSDTSSARIFAALANAICPVDTCCLAITDNSTEKNVSLANITNTRGSALPVANAYTGMRLSLSNIDGFVYNAPLNRATTPVSVTPDQDFYILSRTTTTQVIDLPTTATSYGRVLTFKNIGTVAVESSSANVTPINSLTAGVAMFGAGTAGTWLSMVSDGANWVIMQRS